jgi:hypothetical protein
LPNCCRAVAIAPDRSIDPPVWPLASSSLHASPGKLATLADEWNAGAAVLRALSEPDEICAALVEAACRAS